MKSDKNNISEMKLQAEDITCISCAEDMEKILQETEGILEASVNYSDDSINVRYDSDIINRKQVYLAVRKLGTIRKIISELK
jgi:Cu+-exporting ATPase